MAKPKRQEWLDQAEARFNEWLWYVGDKNEDKDDNTFCICKSPTHSDIHTHAHPKACDRPAKYRYRLNPKADDHRPHNWCEECTKRWLREPATSTGAAMP